MYAPNFEIAKARHDELDGICARASAALQEFPRGPNGLTPDEVKTSGAYRMAKRAYDIAFRNLREFNATYTKTYAIELRIERDKRRAARLAK